MTLETLLLLCWLKACAVTYHLPAEFVKAVADVEGAGFHTGPLNKRKTLYGPMGINTACCVPGTKNPYINILIGVQTLVNHGATSNPTTWKPALKNTMLSLTMPTISQYYAVTGTTRKEG